ncbi:hypothetical protein HMPREF1576_00028 [Gardnerella pickettii JCP7719]|uniref:Uncharacterized protein n=1 Tax=Gardnerella pickettii JCP7719 TaxID=1261061 RepID=S4H7C4_9BIFI|nr:hypothetical protein HMPREF1576_00028 [Gardnerella pickettii JCP7719]
MSVRDTRSDLHSLRARERCDAFCTTFHQKMVQTREKSSAFCTKFDLKHVQKAENRSRATLCCNSRAILPA